VWTRPPRDADADTAAQVSPRIEAAPLQVFSASMLSFILCRLGQAVLVLLVVGMGAFALFQYVGDPVGNMVGQDATPEQRRQLRSDLGLDRSAPLQFARFAGHALRGDFGISLRQGREVSTLIGERLPATLELSFAAAVLATVFGIPLGVFAALRRRHWDAQAAMVLSLLGLSLPGFLVGILLIEVFAVQLGWLPSSGRGATVQVGAWSTGLLTIDGWRHLVLPAVALSLYQLTLVMRLVRAEMLEALRSDYVKFARARGLPDRVVHFRHALRNTLIPVLTISGLQFGGLIAFSIVTETVFAWPGMGSLFIQAVQFADVPVMAACLCLIAVVFVAINLVVDLLYLAVDPRLRAPARAAGVGR
jgi:peptide/nickel transport system permease protein